MAQVRFDIGRVVHRDCGARQCGGRMIFTPKGGEYTGELFAQACRDPEVS
jgi:hypothetical protein